jgi:hypothetical protein
MSAAARLSNLILGPQGSGKGPRKRRGNMARSREASDHASSGEEPRASVPVRWGMVINLAIVLLAGIGIGVLQANARDLAFPAPPAALPLFGAGVVGALTGLVSRLVLRSWHRVLRFLLGFAVAVAWIVVFHATYIVWMRIPLPAYYSSTNLWILDGQLAIACLSILTASLVGRRVHRPAPLEPAYRLFRREPPAVEGKAPLHWSLMLGLGAALLLGAGIGTLQANTDHLVVPVPPLAIALVGAAIMGLLAGVTALVTLQGWTEALRIQIALLILLVWLIAVESTYADWMGLRRLDYLANADNWAELGLLAVSCMGIIVSGLGRRSIPVDIAPEPQRRREPAPQPKRRSGTARKSKIKQKKGQAISLPTPKRSILKRRSGPVEENGVKVTGAAEERCPYCLDIIEDKDARGVVVCEICGSPHHADCWEAAGGMCQVPHLIT